MYQHLSQREALAESRLLNEVTSIARRLQEHVEFLGKRREREEWQGTLHS
jgi:hypothetical protein